MKRIIVVAVIVLALVATAVIAQFKLDSNTHIVISEPLEFVGQSDFSVDLWAGQVHNLPLTVRNPSTEDVGISWRMTVTPENPEITPYLPGAIYDYTILAGTEQIFNWEIRTNDSAAWEGDLTLTCLVVG